MTRAIFLPLVLIASAAAQTPPEPATALARRIAANLTASEPVSLTFRGVSLPARKAIEAEFARRSSGPDPTAIIVTLSEDARGPLWVAEVVRAGKRDAVFFERPGERASEPPDGSLEKHLLWEQDSPILDAARAAEDVVVLSPDGVSVYPRAERASRVMLPVAAPRPWPRDLRGRLIIDGDAVRAWLPGLACSGVLRPGPKLDCRTAEEPWPDSAAPLEVGRNYFTGQPPFYSAALQFRTTLDDRQPEDWGTDIASIETPCGPAVLATARATAEETDSLRAFSISDGRPVAISAPIALPGPVTALWQNRDKVSALAVARSIDNDRYAAFTVTLTCGR